MTRTIARHGGLLLAALLLTAAPAAAQAVHSFHLGVGGFFPAGAGSRSGDDVLLRNYLGEPFDFDPTVTDALSFEFGDLRSGFVVGEWNVGFGNHVEVGLGLGFSRKTVPTIYLEVEDDFAHVPIFQSLLVQTMPITGHVRFLPFGHAATIQPYVGAGVTAVAFRYREQGEFVDSVTGEIFNARYRSAGFAPGGMVLAGIRFPIKGDIFAITFEGRRQFATGDLGTDLTDNDEENDFLADKIDLGGTQFTGGFLVRF